MTSNPDDPCVGRVRYSQPAKAMTAIRTARAMAISLFKKATSPVLYRPFPYRFWFRSVIGSEQVALDDIDFFSSGNGYPISFLL
jgi:hypothetical protein